MDDDETDKNRPQDILELMIVSSIQLVKNTTYNIRFKSFTFYFLTANGKLLVKIFQQLQIIIPSINIPLGPQLIVLFVISGNFLFDTLKGVGFISIVFDFT